MKSLALVAICTLSVGCVSTYSDIVSDFHTIQNGPMCTTVAFDERKFNGQTIEPSHISCPCSQLISVKRLAKKGNESPEAWSCPAPVYVGMNNSVITASSEAHHQGSLASIYVPAVADLAGMTAIGVGLSKSGARLTQSVGGLTVNEHFSTKYIGK